MIMWRRTSALTIVFKLRNDGFAPAYPEPGHPF